MDNESKAANAARIYGICSIVAGFFIPLIGIILGILGILNARKGVNSALAKRAKMGMTLSIIGLVLAIVLWIVNMFLMYGGAM